MRRVKSLIVFISVMLTFALNIGNTAFLGNFGVSAFTPDFDIHSQSAIMVHLDTDITVFRKNELERVYPASATKIMTALVVLDNVPNLSDTVIVTNEMNTGFGANPNFTGASAADFVVGQENLTYLDLLYALMIASACDAANVLAYNVGGDIPTFVGMMNKKAQELGAVNTNFGNPHGLHQKDNYSCAWDMFLITKYVYEKHPNFIGIANAASYEFPMNSRNPSGYVLTNTNRLLRNVEGNTFFFEFARGVKTGSLPYFFDVDNSEYSRGNFSLVSTAVRDGNTYLLVTLGAPYHRIDSNSYNNPGVDNMDDRAFYVYEDHLALFRWAFSQLRYQTVLSANEVIAQISVINGQDADRVQLKPAHDFSTMLPDGLDRTAVLREITYFEEELSAPITKGEVLGYVELMLAGEVLTGGRINLV
ncbi:MAG: D-alanyl-D-alanine carboxypeptidase, partial [Oscillospiraceae bacterium]|nr:D-alanyl-D-alanine carboxypeptidase [Oscillospiraceae bacterium]